MASTPHSGITADTLKATITEKLQAEHVVCLSHKVDWSSLLNEQV